MKKERPLGMRIGEGTFCAGYLIFAFAAGIAFLLGDSRFDRLCALMILLLGSGDAFHLIPRIMIDIRGEKEGDTFRLGLGNLVSSITMTVFYVILIHVVREMHGSEAVSKALEYAVIALAVLRVVLCMFPQNKWFDEEKDSRWGIIRNIPFVVIGILTVAYLFSSGEALMGALVTASFAFYMVVVVFAARKPMLGMMMIPKTICYIWMTCILRGGR